MRKKKRRLVFGSVFVSTFILLILAMPYVMNVAVKSSASASDPARGEISYFRADLFDYEPVKRSTNGSFLVGKTRYYDDAALLLFGSKDGQKNSAAVDGQVKSRTASGSVVKGLSEHNRWVSGQRYKVVSGLVSSELGVGGIISLAANRTAISGSMGVKLFDVTSASTYKGAYSFPFENVGDGYLQYDSSKNHVQVTKTVGDDGLLKMDRVDGSSAYGFMPYNKVSTSKGLNENGYYALSGSPNFFFGMRVEVPFVMTKGGKITTYDGSDENMELIITGDDDVWVFVDGVLVLDLGGIHEKVDGSIDFATGVVTTTGNHFDEREGKYRDEVTTISVENTFIKSLSVGRHKLQVFYLERGGSVSNCKLKFRLQEDKTPDEGENSSGEIAGPATKEPTETEVQTGGPIVAR
jgi:fibro-slime domain-containing protein